jgi:hypothetical protein
MIFFCSEPYKQAWPIIFYVSLIKNDKQTKKGKEINIFKSLARSNFLAQNPKNKKYTPVHSAGYLLLHSEFRSTQEVARQNIQVSFYIRSTGLWPNTWIHVSQSLAIIRNAIHILWPLMFTWSRLCILITY